MVINGMPVAEVPVKRTGVPESAHYLETILLPLADGLLA
jgi:hypothetical protein